MNKTVKTILALAVILFVVYLLFNLFSGSHQQNTASSTLHEEQMAQSYNDYMQKQAAFFDEYVKKFNAQMAKSEEAMEKSLQNQLRFEKLMDRWEQQADRYDTILMKQENSAQ